MNKEKINPHRLLELIITLVVIVFLLAIAFVLRSVNQAETRDVERISEVNIVRAALQFYYIDKGCYPVESEWCSLESDCGTFFQAMVDYLPEIPKDPLYSEAREKYSYQYRTATDGSEYKIYTNLERRGPYGFGSKGSFIISLPKP